MVFEEIIQRLVELGFYQFFLPFIIIAAISYALLRKGQILGESPLINAIVSLSIAFFIFGLPILAGISLVKPLSSFFGQIIVIVLIIAFGLLITGLFVPDLMGKMGEWITSGSIMAWMIVVVLIIAISSGLFALIFSPLLESAGTGKDIFIVIFFLLLFVGIMAAVAGGGKK
jgi:ABC-type uncharacterized transport system permease subunit